MEENTYTKNKGLETGVVYLVGGGPGDPGLLTLRGLECLERAEVVVYDRLVNPRLLEYAPQAELIDVGKLPEDHPIPQTQINAILVEQARAGKTVVRLKGGDPFVFGRGGEEAQALAEAGIRFEIVPGVTSAVAVPAYAGIPVTHRRMARSVAFVTGHSADAEPLDLDWQALSRGVDTLIFLMGKKNLPVIAAALMEAGRAPSTPVAVIAQGTLPRQKVVLGTLTDINEKASEIQPPTVIVVGDVVNLSETLNWFMPEPVRAAD